MDVFSRRLNYRSDCHVDVSWSIAAAGTIVLDVSGSIATASTCTENSVFLEIQHTLPAIGCEAHG